MQASSYYSENIERISRALLGGLHDVGPGFNYPAYRYPVLKWSCERGVTYSFQAALVKLSLEIADESWDHF